MCFGKTHEGRSAIYIYDQTNVLKLPGIAQNNWAKYTGLLET